MLASSMSVARRKTYMKKIDHDSAEIILKDVGLHGGRVGKGGNVVFSVQRGWGNHHCPCDIYLIRTGIGHQHVERQPCGLRLVTIRMRTRKSQKNRLHDCVHVVDARTDGAATDDQPLNQ